jgi:hypothetical protein
LHNAAVKRRNGTNEDNGIVWAERGEAKETALCSPPKDIFGSNRGC